LTTILQETEHTVLGGRLKLHQPAEGYRAAIDPVLLAAAVPCRAGQKVLDLGTGIGTAALCLLARASEVKMVGVDIQDDLVDLAKKNAGLNGFQDNVRFLTADINRLTALSQDGLIEGSFDHVIANPPFFRAGHAQSSPNRIKATANVEGEGGLDAWLIAAARFLRPGGMLSMIHTMDRMQDVVEALAHNQLGSLELFPLWPKQGRPAKRFIMRCRKGGKNASVLHAGLVLHEPSGDYTPAANRILKEAAALIIEESG
jgi:tRNA1(Val) A37 N6-methylase TrmN6